MESATSHRIATVERVFELFNRLPGDPVARRASPETDELLGLFDEDVVFTQPAMQPEGAQYFKGREQLRESWDRWFEVWEYHRSFPDLIDERGNRVLALSENRFRGRDGIELVVGQPDRSWDGSAGRDAMIEGWDDWFSAWEEQRTQLLEIKERGDHVLALTNDRFRGRDGIEIEMKGGSIYSFQEGTVVRIQTFFDHESATPHIRRPVAFRPQ